MALETIRPTTDQGSHSPLRLYLSAVAARPSVLHPIDSTKIVAARHADPHRVNIAYRTCGSTAMASTSGHLRKSPTFCTACYIEAPSMPHSRESQADASCLPWSTR